MYPRDNRSNDHNPNVDADSNIEDLCQSYQEIANNEHD